MSTVKVTKKSSVLNSINFEWNFNVSPNSSWNITSSNFNLKPISNACSLRIQATYCPSSNSYHSVHMTMTFINCLLKESIDLIMMHDSSKKKFIFHLKSENGTPNVFSATKNIYVESSFNGPNQSLKFTLIYEGIPRINPRHENEIFYNNFKELLESEKYADFSIKTQSKTFKVHKGILSCRCDVLAKAIEADMIEKKNNEIQLDQWDPAVMKEFLSFIYTGSCEVLMNPYQLFELADYYQLEELKLNCIEYLENNMNLKSIVHTLALSDEEQYGLGHLQTLAYSFVKNNEKTLVKDVDFQDYLTQSINIKNLVFVLRLAHNYNLKGPLERAKEFIKQNYEKVFENKECETYFSSQGRLVLDILKYIIESSAQI